jgi:hypothetical protein
MILSIINICISIFMPILMNVIMLFVTVVIYTVQYSNCWFLITIYEHTFVYISFVN